MFDFCNDYDPVTPAGGRLLEELGLDARSVRDALADDLARRCPDREARTDGSWRRASRSVIGGGRGERCPGSRPFAIPSSSTRA